MTPLEHAKARLLELGTRHDAARPLAVSPLWRYGAFAGLGLLTGAVLARGRRASSWRAALAARFATLAAPWLIPVLLKR